MAPSKSNKFSPEVRERAARMVQEHRNAYLSKCAAIESIAPKIGCVPQIFHEWVCKHESNTCCAMASPRVRIMVFDNGAATCCLISS